MSDDMLRDRLVAAVGDRYELESELGRGGMGVVFGGRDVRLRRRVAIKVLPPELAYRQDVKSRFLREAQTAAQLSHPSIVPIYEVEDRDGLVYFIMALVEGESLAARLHRDGPMPPSAVVRVLREVADALSAAHRAGIIHRDIKPDNILLEASHGRPVVTDFGIARAAEGDVRLTATGVAVGTPTYMSPEQATGERELDGRSDVYSLAIVGYQMLVGAPPFEASSTAGMLLKHISDTPASIMSRRADVPSGLAQVIERALAKRPDDRWPDAAAFRDALDHALTAPASSARVAAPPPPPTPTPGPTPAPSNSGNSRSSDDLNHVAREMPVVRPAGVRRGSITPPPSESAALIARAFTTRLRDDSRRSRGGTDASGRPSREAPVSSNPHRGSSSARGRGPSNLQNPWDRAPGEPPTVPPWMPASWREVRRQWRPEDRSDRDAWRERLRSMRDQRRQERSAAAEGAPALPIEHRITSFRRSTARTAVTVGTLALVNAFTSPFVPWFLIPSAFMTLGLLRKGGGLWADGIRLKDIFGKDARIASPNESTATRRLSSRELAMALAPSDVLAGPHGDVIRRAAEDRAIVREVVAKLGKADRELIPDVLPTADALAERAGSLAQALHRLDEDVSPDALEELDVRIAAAKAAPEATPDRDRRVQLLERQRATIADLVDRRGTLVGQLESASLMLQNMKLDLLALRSAGVQSSIDDNNGATQEARALSREIAHVLEAAKEIRK